MKPKHLFALAVLCLSISLPVGLFLKALAQNPSSKPGEKQDEKTSALSDYRLSGPYTHENLTVFLVHGKDQTTKTFLTLQEALAQKKVRVYETKEVNELAIRNLSNQDIYVQAGEVVRGAGLPGRLRRVAIAVRSDGVDHGGVPVCRENQLRASRRGL